MQIEHWMISRNVWAWTTLSFFLISMLSIIGLFDWMDLAVMNWVYHDAPGMLTGAMEWITLLGSVEIIAGLSLMVMSGLLVKKRIRETILFAVVSGGGLVLNYLLKLLFQRERPGELNMIDAFGIEFALPSYSYPSGHTMRAAILILIVTYLLIRLYGEGFSERVVMTVGVTLLFLVAVSRVLTGAHFPIDAVGAVLASVAWVTFCLWLYDLRFADD
ncbi:phosphatase PAP2 family protein [Salisediminibacterium beveridgei]|nr:phosphatase PAP2 family protein [Salisediminibacterium beveridgei]